MRFCVDGDDFAPSFQLEKNACNGFRTFLTKFQIWNEMNINGHTHSNLPLSLSNIQKWKWSGKSILICCSARWWMQEFPIKINRWSCAKIFDWQHSQSRTKWRSFTLFHCGKKGKNRFSSSSLVVLCVTQPYTLSRVYYVQCAVVVHVSLYIDVRIVSYGVFFSPFRSSKPHNVGKYTRQ